MPDSPQANDTITERQIFGSDVSLCHHSSILMVQTMPSSLVATGNQSDLAFGKLAKHVAWAQAFCNAMLSCHFLLEVLPTSGGKQRHL